MAWPGQDARGEIDRHLAPAGEADIVRIVVGPRSILSILETAARTFRAARIAVTQPIAARRVQRLAIGARQRINRHLPRVRRAVVEYQRWHRWKADWPAEWGVPPTMREIGLSGMCAATARLPPRDFRSNSGSPTEQMYRGLAPPRPTLGFEFRIGLYDGLAVDLEAFGQFAGAGQGAARRQPSGAISSMIACAICR